MTEICKNHRATMAAIASITFDEIAVVTDVFCRCRAYRVTRGSFISFSFHFHFIFISISLHFHFIFGSLLLNYPLLAEIHAPVMMTVDELVFQFFVRFDLQIRRRASTKKWGDRFRGWILDLIWCNRWKDVPISP